jgi:molybdenum cofactor cytidylyltransferase
MRRVVVVVLAAGRSTRFSDHGAHKLLARLGTESVIRHSVRAAVASGVGDVIVVTGAEADAVSRELNDLSVRMIHAPDFATGMAASLRRGVQVVLGTADAIVVALGDQPTVRAEAYRQVVARWRDSAAAIVVPRYQGLAEPSHPPLFDATTFDELLALSGDVGARSVIASNRARVAEVTLDWPAPRDIDTIADLALVAHDVDTTTTDPNSPRKPNAMRVE